MRLVSALAASAAVWLLLAPPARGPLRPRRWARWFRGGRPDPTRPSGFAPAVGLGVGLVAAVLLATVDGTRLALGLVVLATAAAGGVLVRRSRAAKAAAERRRRVVEVCEALVGELRAGQPLVASLDALPGRLARPGARRGGGPARRRRARRAAAPGPTTRCRGPGRDRLGLAGVAPFRLRAGRCTGPGGRHRPGPAEHAVAGRGRAGLGAGHRPPGRAAAAGLA